MHQSIILDFNSPMTSKITLYDSISVTVCSLSHWCLLYCPHQRVKNTLFSTLGSVINMGIACISNSSSGVLCFSEQHSYSIKFTFHHHTLLLCLFNAWMWFTEGSGNICQFLTFVLVDSWICMLTQYLRVFLSSRIHTDCRRNYFEHVVGGGGVVFVNSFSEEYARKQNAATAACYFENALVL